MEGEMGWSVSVAGRVNAKGGGAADMGKTGTREGFDEILTCAIRAHGPCP